jgi:hypothetical protein
MRREQTRARLGIFIGIAMLLVLAALAALPFFFFKPPAPPAPFEVQNFIGPAEIYSRPQNTWVSLERGQLIQPRDKIRTGKGGEVDLRISDQVRIRVKENSEGEAQGPKLFEKTSFYRFHLNSGSLLGTTEKHFQGPLLEILTSVSISRVREGGVSFHVQANPEVNNTLVGVLRGNVEVVSTAAKKSMIVKGIEKVEVTGTKHSVKEMKVSQKDWEEMKEAYELIQKSAAFEAHQIDLSKEAGSLYRYVFDHGTFFTPKMGFADREFIKDEATGRVRLKVEYDVFPYGAVVGVYMKTRDLDLSRFKAIQFEVRGDPEEGFPESFRIEFKSVSGAVTTFAPRDFKLNWQVFRFPLKIEKPTPITEATLVLSNEKAGTHKKGFLHIRDVHLEPKS